MGTSVMEADTVATLLLITNVEKTDCWCWRRLVNVID